MLIGPEEGTERPEQQTTPAVYVQAEQNLATIGYYDAGYKRRKPTAADPVKTLALPDGRTFRIVPTVEYGYPNTEDLDFQRAFEAICLDQLERRDHVDGNGKKHRRPHLDLPICFSIGELVRRSGRAATDADTSARDRKAVRAWVRRNTHTGIEGPLKLANQKHAGTVSTHLFLQSYTPGDKLPNGEASDTVKVWPAPWYLSNLANRADYLIDLTLHQQLGRHAIAKNLYPVLLAGFLATNPHPFRKSYRDTVALFGMPFYPNHKHRERQLAAAVAKLRALDFLDRTAWTHRDEDSTVTYWPGRKAREDMAERRRRRDLADQLTTPTAIPAPNQPDPAQATTDLVALLAADLEDYSRDHKSAANWRYLARLTVAQDRPQLVHQAISETRAADLPPGTVDNKGALLNSRLRDLLAQFDLFSPRPRTTRPTPSPYEPSTTATASPPPTLPLHSPAQPLPDTDQTPAPGAPREGAPSGSSEPA